MRPSARSCSTLAMLTALQLLVGLRGVKRWMWRSPSTEFRRPSIQPKQSASSTASDHVRLGLPVCFFQ